MRLLDAVETVIGRFPAAALAKAAKELSLHYRDHRATNVALRTPLHFAAYLATRLPATYAAISAVLSTIPSWFIPERMLDVGAGPGTATWAAVERFPSLIGATLIEREREFISLGKEIAKQGDLPELEWISASLEKEIGEEKYPLIIVSYALGELKRQESLVGELWERTGDLLVIVEPGTVAGFERIRKARWQMIQAGGLILAPCPHEKQCPIGPGDWCHFSTRLPRTEWHRRAKEASLPFEDEKFSYVIGSKIKIEHFGERILRHPLKKEGHLQLKLCSLDGKIKNETLTRSDSNYKSAKKLNWGDIFH